MSNVVIWAIDIGSVMNNKFGWCRIDGAALESGHDIRALASGVAADLGDARAVALGFECPLFVPVPDDPRYLTSARAGEGNRAWSAGAGCGALATGLSESVWVLERIRSAATVPVLPTFGWDAILAGSANLFLWEAFVSGAAKAIEGIAHVNDAEIAALAFRNALADVPGAKAVTAPNPFSLIGAALLRAGLTTDLRVLNEPCVVIKA
jgi:hypothetical protein